MYSALDPICVEKTHQQTFIGVLELFNEHVYETSYTPN